MTNRNNNEKRKEDEKTSKMNKKRETLPYLNWKDKHTKCVHGAYILGDRIVHTTSV